MNSALVGLSCKRFTIFNLGAHSWAVNVGVARRCRSTNHIVSCRTVRILSATVMYLCRSEWMFHIASRNPFMCVAVAVATGRVEPAPLELEGRPVVAPEQDILPEDTIFHRGRGLSLWHEECHSVNCMQIALILLSYM